jgi:deoxyribodipyrimidine photo-lyase
MGSPTIIWFRQDLRLEDQPALCAAIARGGPVIPLFIWAPEEEGEWVPGEASRWWLHHSLSHLQEELHQLALTLIFRKQSSLEAILDIIKQTGADAVFWNRRYEPYVVRRDALIEAELRRRGMTVQIFNSSLLFEPWEIFNKQNKPYQVFTPFWKFCSHLEEPTLPLRKPEVAKPYPGHLESEALDHFHLLPTIPWDEGLRKKWRPGTSSAKDQLNIALQQVIEHYIQRRDKPALRGTTELSPYLHHGEISPRMIWQAVRQKFGKQEGAEAFLRQLGWREFAYYLLHHFPHTPNEALHSDFNGFPWQVNEQALKAWQKGQTGYPIIDAGMRQLWRTGWMHNRVRMIVGSFLVKDLLIDWLEGVRWFWDTLVDADLANNTLGWQWVAGCGADAAPYFRIFNPMTQGEKFDQMGEYVRQWVPEIRGLPDAWIHRPWEAPEEILKQSRVILGTTYPKPIIDHDQARKKALEAYARI